MHKSTPIRLEFKLCFQKSDLFVVGGDLYCFHTQTDSFEAVIWASSSPLVTNPTGAEVMRDQREGWNENSKQRKELDPALSFSSLNRSLNEKKLVKQNILLQHQTRGDTLDKLFEYR